MFAFTLLAIVPILMQRIAIVAEAHVRADSIAALMLTAAIVGRALVDVSEENCSEAGALYSFIRMEFNAQRIALGCGSGWYGGATICTYSLQSILAQFRIYGDRVISAISLLLSIALKIEMGEIQ